MKRVVVTGMGIISCIGNDLETVTESLKTGRSGICFQPEYAELGFRSHVAGEVKGVDFDKIPRQVRRFMGDAAAYSYLAMEQAIEDAGLSLEEISDPRIGLVAGSGGASTSNVVEAEHIAKSRGIKRIGPYMVTRTMGSTVSACLATPFKIKGVNYSISSACSTSAHCIGNGAELIQLGKQDIVFAGGGEELHWTMSSLFDAMGALSSKYNDNPEAASRAYDANRDGFVIAGGGAMVVLEEYEHAKARGAKIYGELTGYGATSDGYNMVAPSGEGAVRCMEMAKSTAKNPVQYINSHGTSTPAGDIPELKAIREVFGENSPMISSTKSLTGHSLGATGAQEAIYSLLMMKEGFVSASKNVDVLDPEAKGMNIVTEKTDADLNCVMSNSFGFGGTNSTLVFEKVED